MATAATIEKPPTGNSVQQDGMTDAIAELMLRHELGDFPAPVRRRLTEIFTTDPPDAIERLHRACKHLGITSLTPATLERTTALSLQRSRTHEQEEHMPQEI